nr:hypothetical protein [Pseudomonas aeruginosa]
MKKISLASSVVGAALLGVASVGVRISEHRDRPFRLIVTGHFANA